MRKQVALWNYVEFVYHFETLTTWNHSVPEYVYHFETSPLSEELSLYWWHSVSNLVVFPYSTHGRGGREFDFILSISTDQRYCLVVHQTGNVYLIRSLPKHLEDVPLIAETVRLADHGYKLPPPSWFHKLVTKSRVELLTLKSRYKLGSVFWVPPTSATMRFVIQHFFRR